MIIVSDTSPLSGLAIIGHLRLLQQIYGRVVIPVAVADELRRGGEDDERINDVLDLDWIEVRQSSNLDLINTLTSGQNLDRGESEVIALALELKADGLLIDERLGRRQAQRLGISVTGLLGVLLVAKRQGLIDVIRPLMEALRDKAGFRISHQLYQEILFFAGEDNDD